MFYLALALSLVFGVLAAVLAGAETAVMVLPPGRVHRLAEAEARGSVQLESLSQRSHRLRAASALASGLAYTSAAVLGMAVGTAAAGSVALLVELGAVAVSVFVMYALTQALPRTLAVANPERIGLGSAPFTRVAVGALYPLARVLAAPFSWLIAVAGADEAPSAWVTSSEYRAFEKDQETEREEAEEALLEAVSDFAEKVAREVMVPRTDMKALPDTARVEDAVELIVETGFTRIPVYHESVDDVRGVLYAKDLLGAMASQRAHTSVMALARQPYFVPETKPIEELLGEMRSRTHIAIVADEYGGTAGLVTLEDLIEEIVGEISDEYDREEPLVVDLGEGRFCVDARLPVGELNELFGTSIETEADSIGGLFTQIAGRIPTTGDSLEVEGLRLTVDHLQGTRIRQLAVEPAAADDEGGSDAQSDTD